MKHLSLLCCVVALALPVSGHSRGGDLGGGGQARLFHALKLTPEQARELHQAQTEEEAYMFWRQILKESRNKEENVMQGLFEAYVMPQIE